MDQIDTIEGRVLYVIYEMHKSNRISLSQKGALKGTHSLAYQI